MWSNPISQVLLELSEDGDKERVSLSSSSRPSFPGISSSEFSSDTEPTMKCECNAATAGSFLAAPSCCAMTGRREQAANTAQETQRLERRHGEVRYEGTVCVCVCGKMALACNGVCHVAKVSLINFSASIMQSDIATLWTHTGNISR